MAGGVHDMLDKSAFTYGVSSRPAQYWASSSSASSIAARGIVVVNINWLCREVSEDMPGEDCMIGG